MNFSQHRYEGKIAFLCIAFSVVTVCLSGCDTAKEGNDVIAPVIERHPPDKVSITSEEKTEVQSAEHIRSDIIESDVDAYSRLLSDAAATDVINMEQYSVLQPKVMSHFFGNQYEKTIEIITQLGDISALDYFIRQDLRFYLMSAYNNLHDYDNAKIIAQKIISDYEDLGSFCRKTAGYEETAHRTLISIYNNEKNAEDAIRHAALLYERSDSWPHEIHSNINATLYVTTLARHGKFAEARNVWETFQWDDDRQQDASKYLINRYESQTYRDNP